jgi:hypothetical protein
MCEVIRSSSRVIEKSKRGKVELHELNTDRAGV